MICESCGKEIMVAVRNCPYCGAKLPVDESMFDPDDFDDLMDDMDMKQEPVMEETEIIRVVSFPDDEDEPEDLPAEEEPVKEEPRDIPVYRPGRTGSGKSEDVKKMAEKAYGTVMDTVRQNVHKEDFIPLLEHLKNPSADPEFTITSAAAVYVLIAVFNAVAFSGFFKGIFAGLILTAGIVLVQYLDNSSSFNPLTALIRAAEALEVPAVLMMIAALFAGAYTKSMIFVIAAAVKYAMECSELAENTRKGYLHTAVVAAVLVAAGFITGIL